MMYRSLFLMIAAFGLLASVGAGQAVRAETQTEIINESRTYLFFKIADAKAQGLLPPGWVVNPVPSGPAKGANFLLALLDRHLTTDPEGKPLGAGAARYAVLAVVGKNEAAGASGAVIVGGYTDDREGVPGAYKVYSFGTVGLERSAKAGTGGQDAVTEVWSVAADGGERLDVRLSYTRAVPALVKFDAKTYSGADGKFYRIYRGDQGLDVVRSTVTNVNRATQADVKASGPKLGKLFEDAQLINITYMPWYRRNTFLP